MWKLLIVSGVAFSLALAILWTTGVEQVQAAVKCTYEYNEQTGFEERVCRWYPDPTATPDNRRPTAKPKPPTVAPTRARPTPPPPTRVRPTPKPPTATPTPTRIRPTPRPTCDGRWTFDGVSSECIKTPKRRTATSTPTPTPVRLVPIVPVPTKSPDQIPQITAKVVTSTPTPTKTPRPGIWVPGPDGRPIYVQARKLTPTPDPNATATPTPECDTLDLSCRGGKWIRDRRDKREQKDGNLGGDSAPGLINPVTGQPGTHSPQQTPTTTVTPKTETPPLASRNGGNSPRPNPSPKPTSTPEPTPTPMPTPTPEPETSVLVSRYDADGDSNFTRTELGQAIRDYADGKITYSQVLKLYLEWGRNR